jgi:hypothetical protein
MTVLSRLPQRVAPLVFDDHGPSATRGKCWRRSGRKAIREIGSSQGSSAPVYGFAELSRLMGFEEGARAAFSYRGRGEVHF